MKIIPIAVFLFLANMQISYCPNLNELAIPASKPITEMPILENHYKPLIDAIYYHEAKRNPNAYNPKEEAVGGLQIRRCRLKHYNDLTGKNYTLEDMYNFEIAKEVFLFFCSHDNRGRPIEWKSFEVAARNWNGRWDLTEKYWASIQSLLHNQKILNSI